MKTLDQIRLTQNELEALAQLRQRLSGMYGIQSICLYGSTARGEADKESDQDLLIVTESPLKRTVRHEITGIVFDINLQYETNFSTLVVDRVAWDHGWFTVLPLKQEILQEGVAV